MKTTLATLAAFLLTAGDGGNIKWSTDHDKSIAEAAARGMPIMMYFTQDG